MTTITHQPDQQPAVPLAVGTAPGIRELPRRPNRKAFGPLAFLISSLFIAAAAFYAGVLVEKHHVPAASTATFSAASRSGGTSTTIAGRVGAGTASGVQGTITLINGTTLYVTQAGGTITKVQTSPQSQITKSVASTITVSNLQIGDSVAVTGSPGANGSVQAITVRDLGASGATRTATTSATRTTTSSGGGFGGGFNGGPPGGG